MADLLVFRDLIKDRLGNYYFVNAFTSDKKVILVNAVVKFASNRIINDDYCKEHEGEVVTHFATNQLKNKIENLGQEEFPGSVYLLEQLEKEGYEFVVDGLYDRNPNS